MSPTDEVENAIQAFQTLKTDPDQLLRWHAAVEKRRLQQNDFRLRLKLVLAGVATGLVLGTAWTAMFFKNNLPSDGGEKYSATFAMISVKNL